MNNEWLQVADHVGASLIREALWSGSRCNWLASGTEPFGSRSVPSVHSLGPCVYDGTAGIGLFLGLLHAKTGDALAARVAVGAVEHALSRTGDIPAQVALGHYTGQFGVGYAAVQVGSCTGRGELQERGLALIRQTLQLDTRGRFVLDVMSGYAGLVAPLLSLHAQFGQPWLLEAAQRCGQELLARARVSERGVSWDTTSELAEMVALMDLPAETAGKIRPPPGRPHLGGFSHGSGGIAWALLELAARTGDAKALQMAEGGMAYEDSWFEPAFDQWRDLRHEQCSPNRSGGASVAWCHGATGIGLASLRAWQVTRRPNYLQRLEVALRIVTQSLRQGLAGECNFSLCHGVAGDADLLISVANATGDTRLLPLVEAVAEHGRQHFDLPQRPWPSGSASGQESPGLMLGLAGTGYFYLRAADRENTPSMLAVGNR